MFLLILDLPCVSVYTAVELSLSWKDVPPKCVHIGGLPRLEKDHFFKKQSLLVVEAPYAFTRNGPAGDARNQRGGEWLSGWFIVVNLNPLTSMPVHGEDTFDVRGLTITSPGLMLIGYIGKIHFRVVLLLRMIIFWLWSQLSLFWDGDSLCLLWWFVILCISLIVVISQSVKHNQDHRHMSTTNYNDS